MTTINMELLLLIIFISIVVQYIVEALKVLFKAVGKNWGCKWLSVIFTSALIAMFWTILLCFAAKAGIFKAFGFILAWSWLDYLATGILASLGASKIYDFVLSFNDCRLCDRA